MANKEALVDTSILIDYFRKTDKSKTQLIKLINRDFKFKISSITEYEIYSGATASQKGFWDDILK